MSAIALSELSKKTIKEAFRGGAGEPRRGTALIQTAIFFDHPEEVVAEVLGFSREELLRLEEAERQRARVAGAFPTR